MNMHDDETAISGDTARQLITRQFPQWSSLPIRRIASSGTVNAIFRIGDDLTARFPLRLGDPDGVRAVLQREAEAAALLAAHSPFPAPRPIALGEPGLGYPMPWSVQTWLTGTIAADAGASASIPFAHDLAALIAVLRTVDTGRRRCQRESRGGDLQTHDAWVETCLRNSEKILDVAAVRSLWHGFRELPREAPDVMTHGDLTPGNLLVSDRRLVLLPGVTSV